MTLGYFNVLISILKVDETKVQLTDTLGLISIWKLSYTEKKCMEISFMFCFQIVY